MTLAVAVVLLLIGGARIGVSIVESKGGIAVLGVVLTACGLALVFAP